MKRHERKTNQVSIVGGGGTVMGGSGYGGRSVPVRAGSLGGVRAGSRLGRHRRHPRRVVVYGGWPWYPYGYPYYPYYPYAGFFPAYTSPYWFGGWPYNYPFGYGYAYPGWAAPPYQYPRSSVLPADIEIPA
jgi:hypothetical protein